MLRAVLAVMFVFVLVLSFFWRSKSKNGVQIDSFSWKTDIWGPHLATTTLTWNITRYLPPYLASNSKDESKKNVEFSIPNESVVSSVQLQYKGEWFDSTTTTMGVGMAEESVAVKKKLPSVSLVLDHRYSPRLTINLPEPNMNIVVVVVYEVRTKMEEEWFVV